ncbi:MAG TPA: hypothetical protein VF526_15395 [Solirubrobacteraceae bacterium]
MRPPDDAEVCALFARLTDRGLTLEGIARLTDRQISDVYFCPRTERGDPEEVIEAEETDRPQSKAEELATLWALGQALRTPEEELRAAWQKKYPGDAPWES